MRFTLEQQISHPVDVVEAAFTDPDLFEHMGAVDDLGRPEVLARTEEGDLVQMEVRYAFAGELGPPLSAVLDPTRLSWVEKSTLDRRTHRTEFHILPDHYSGHMHCKGTVELRSDGNGGTRRVADGHLDVDIPLVGRKVERAIIDSLHDQAETQARAVDGWLEKRSDG